MIIKTQAFVLRKYKFRETSLLVHLYTKDFGKVKAICKGVRQLKSRKLSHFEPPILLEVQIYDKPNRELQLLSDSYLLSFFSHIKGSLDLYLRSQYILELVENFTQGHLKNETLFCLIHAYLNGLKDENFESFTVAFSLKFLKILGIFPNLLECFVCREKITKEAFFYLEQNGVTCHRQQCQGGHSISHRLTVKEIWLVYELIQKTFIEIEREAYGRKELEQIQHTTEDYMNFLTNLNLKTPKVISQMTQTRDRVPQST